MKKSLSYLGLILVALVSLSSCSSKPDAPIPADAAFVMHINGKTISEKLPWSDLKQTEWFKLASANVEGDSLGTVLLNDPTQSGININANGWIFVANRGKGAYSALIWDLSDAAKFEGLIKRTAPEVTVQKKEKTNYISEGTMLLAWDEKKIMFLSDASEFSRELNSLSDNSAEEAYDDESETYEEPFRLTNDSLLQIALEIQNLKSSAKLSNDGKFADLVNTKGDVHFWLNAGKLYGNSLAGSLLSLSKLSTLLEGNIAAITIGFNDGSIDIDSKGYVGKELAGLYEKYQATNFDENALKNVPAGEVNMALAMNYPPEGVKALLTLFGVDGLANTFMQEAGFSVDEFIKANGGNLFLSLTDFNIKKVEKSFEGFDGEPITYSTTEPDGKLLFGAEVKDRSAFQKMMDIAKRLLSEKAGMSEDDMSKVPYDLKDKWFLAGSDATQMKNYGSAQTQHAFIDRIKGHPIGLFINITSFIKGAMSELGDDPMAKGVAELSLKFWKDLVMTGGEFKNGASISKISLNLGDANTNSLKSLNQYFGQIAKLVKEAEARREAEMMEEDGYDDPTEVLVDSTYGY